MLKKLFAILLLSGCAFAHSVSLTWDASTSGATFYRVYRAVSTCNAAFVLMGQVPGTQLNFVNGSNPDGSPLVEGQTYCYAVSTVLNGSEGVKSVPVTATIPVAPPPPTNVKAIPQ